MKLRGINYMEMNQWIEKFDLGSVIDRIGISTNDYALGADRAVVPMILAAAGILLCFLGWKIVRLWAVFAGFALGCAAGSTVALMAGLWGNGIWIAGGVTGIVCAALSGWLYRVGVFLIVLTGMTVICITAVNPDNWIKFSVCLLVSLAAAVLSVRFTAILTILVTSVSGAICACNSLYGFFSENSELLRIVLTILLAAAGIMVQLLLESKKQKTASLKRAEQIREERSAANDVERARAVIENLNTNTGKKSDL